MEKVFLCINYGAYEGWQLEEVPSPAEALLRVKNGETYGNPWMIVKELPVIVHSENGEPG